MEEQEIAENVNAAPAVDAETAAVPEEETAASAAPEVIEEIADETAEKPFEPRVRKPVVAEMLERTQKDLMKMLDFLGYEDAAVKAAESNGEIELSVESQDAGRIIGRKGQTLESLQLLINRMMQKDDPDYPRIQICIDGYSTRRPDSRGRAAREPKEDGSFEHRRNASEHGDRRRRGGNGGERGERRRRFGDDREGRGGNGGDDRDDILRQQALDAAKEVRRWGEPKTLPAMNAHDRRIIHITLENETDLQTESEGEGPKKSIVISLKK